MYLELSIHIIQRTYQYSKMKCIIILNTFVIQYRKKIFIISIFQKLISLSIDTQIKRHKQLCFMLFALLNFSLYIMARQPYCYSCQPAISYFVKKTLRPFILFDIYVPYSITMNLRQQQPTFHQYRLNISIYNFTTTGSGFCVKVCSTLYFVTLSYLGGIRRKIKIFALIPTFIICIHKICKGK